MPQRQRGRKTGLRGGARGATHRHGGMFGHIPFKRFTSGVLESHEHVVEGRPMRSLSRDAPKVDLPDHGQLLVRTCPTCGVQRPYGYVALAPEHGFCDDRCRGIYEERRAGWFEETEWGSERDVAQVFHEAQNRLVLRAVGGGRRVLSAPSPMQIYERGGDLLKDGWSTRAMPQYSRVRAMCLRWLRLLEPHADVESLEASVKRLMALPEMSDISAAVALMRQHIRDRSMRDRLRDRWLFWLRRFSQTAGSFYDEDEASRIASINSTESARAAIEMLREREYRYRHPRRRDEMPRKFTHEQVASIRMRVKRGETCAAIATEFGVSKPLIVITVQGGLYANAPGPVRWPRVGWLEKLPDTLSERIRLYQQADESPTPVAAPLGESKRVYASQSGTPRSQARFKALDLLRNGSSLRDVMSVTGISCATALKYRRLVAATLKCKCGQSNGHKGWCEPLLVNSLERRRYLSNTTRMADVSA